MFGLMRVITHQLLMADLKEIKFEERVEQGKLRLAAKSQAELILMLRGKLKLLRKEVAKAKVVK